MNKILIVESDAFQRSRLKEMLEVAGYRVTTACDAIRGLIAVTRDRPDLILSDILMPRMDGFTFIREIKSRTDLGRIPFLFIASTAITEEESQFAQMLGAEAIFGSTDDTIDMLSTIAACLRHHARVSLPLAPAW
jgi:CheY-like chemotaxis protein